MKNPSRCLDAKRLVLEWQSLLSDFRAPFTAPGWARFAAWTTALVLCDEQHTLTQCLIALNRQPDWHAAESFAEYGAWDLPAVEGALMRLVERLEAPTFGGYHPAAADDTLEQRCSLETWGVCTFAHRSTRNPKHPKLLRAHNWVLLGSLLRGAPWTYLPTAARLYLRKSQLPPGEVFATKNALVVQMLRQCECVSAAPVLGIFDGGYAHRTLVRPCLQPPPNRRPIAILTRPRRDARLYAPLPPGRGAAGPAKKGRPRHWGQRLPSPRHSAQWQLPWQEGVAWIYGRRRKIRYQRLVCRWAVSGPEVPVAAYVFQVEGYSQAWFLITSALDLSAEQVVEAYAARFRQEDGIRDHKQRLGMEEVRAWTKGPVLRTFLTQLVAMSLLRLLQRKLEREGTRACYPATPWNRHKGWSSLLDIRRLLWQHRPAFSQFCAGLGEVPKNASQAA